MYLLLLGLIVLVYSTKIGEQIILQIYQPVLNWVDRKDCFFIV